MNEVGAQTEGISLSEFLTDGNLARLCDEIGALSKRAVVLRDERGRRIVASDGAAGWRIDETDVSMEAGELSAPLVVAGEVIGRIDAPLAGDGDERLASVMRLVASTASELCSDVLELRQRVVALEALQRLSSLLVSSANLTSVLEATLDSALSALGLDAGSLVLFPSDADGFTARDDEAELRLAVSRNLSKAWLTSPLPLSRRRVFDRRVLGGEVVAVSDLLSDEHVLNPERCREEGLASFLSAGLVFGGRLIGLIRLYGREVRVFSELDRGLIRALGEQAGAAVHQARMVEIEQEEKRIQRQLSLATDIQMRMLPQAMPVLRGFEIAARCEPCFELGGDFYDLIELSGKLGVVIGDVVGKGIGAALLMSAVRSSLRAYADDEEDLGSLLGRVNRAMCRDTMTHEFATIWYGVIDPEARTLTYGSAGHDPSLLMPAGGRSSAEIVELHATGLVVGVLAQQTYESRTIELKAGDTIVAYTDGVLDRMNFEGKRYGRARLKESLAQILGKESEASAERIMDHLVWDMRRFAGLAEQNDDETIVVMRFR
ncbi:MAG: SpoIIE family protein phosphatase [Phycisphaeraceae bacterium]|nr:SpoIIE family protein phosphatase [Phycisphaeraceae bacterium]MCW5764049.1 SpoIIE family protein phosphatase [Phycisphaeraceae bacterium]